MKIDFKLQELRLMFLCGGIALVLGVLFGDSWAFLAAFGGILFGMSFVLFSVKNVLKHSKLIDAYNHALDEYDKLQRKQDPIAKLWVKLRGKIHKKVKRGD